MLSPRAAELVIYARVIFDLAVVCTFVIIVAVKMESVMDSREVPETGEPNDLRN